MASGRAAAVAGAVLALALATSVVAACASSRARSGFTELRDPFNRRQQLALPFGERSHWLQPWRAYVDTVPATRLESALGMNFNVPPDQTTRVAQLLARAGFHRVRYEIPWCDVSFTDPNRFTNARPIRAVLHAFRVNGLRPLILLNANEGCPGPLRRFRVHVVSPASAGARTLQLDSASVAQVAPGLTGLDSQSPAKAAATLFTSVSGHTVSLSRPLGRNLAPGWYAASTLRYKPFGAAGTADFNQTLAGWLDYVGLVARTAKAVLGSDAFDVEVWNELTFGSDFLDLNTYYSTAVAGVDLTATEHAILTSTIAYLRNSSNGVSGVGIGDGFTNEEPWDSGATVPRGLTAIDKHPYAGPVAFPSQAKFNDVRPVDALGHLEGRQDTAGNWHDDFIPRYTAFFPEYYMTGIQTETLIRDLSPYTTMVHGTPHGRYTHPPGGSPPVMWLTETALDPHTVPRNVRPRFKAKEALRYFVSWVNKGVHALYLFAAGYQPYSFVNVRAPGGGATLRAIGRLTKTLQGGRKVSRPLSLTLAAVGSSSDHAQFRGNGSARYPTLYDRDVVGFFPFQLSDRRAAIALYVMTRNLLTSYRPNLPLSDPRRYDLPPEEFRLTIRGTTTLGSRISATDPLDGRPVPVRVVSRLRGRLVVDIPLTDSPRLLLLG